MDSLFYFACSTCNATFKHGSGNGDAAGWAILFMLLTIVPMLAGIGFLMFRIARREKNSLDPQYADDFQAPAQS